MDAERWQKVESIFHAVLHDEPNRRDAILNQLCGNDDSLRREIESLLLHHDKAETFIETPAFADAKVGSNEKERTHTAEMRTWPSVA
jgi:hypothetical protein